MPGFTIQIVHDVVPDRRHRPGDGRALRLDQPHDRLGIHEPIRQHDVGTCHQRGIRQTPGVGVEHRHDRECLVREAQSHAVAAAHGHRVQVTRPVPVDHPLRVAGCSAGVTHCGRRVLVDLRPLEFVGLGRGDLVVAQNGLAGGFQRRDIAGADGDHGVHGLHPRQHRCQDRGERDVGDDDLVLGLVGDEFDLLGEQPDVEGVQHRPHRGHRDVSLQVLLVVPHERGHPLVAVDAEAAQRVGQPGGLLAEFAIGRVPESAVTGCGGHDAIAVDTHRVPQDFRDGQRGVLHCAVHGSESIPHGRDSARRPASRMTWNHR